MFCTVVGYGYGRGLFVSAYAIHTAVFSYAVLQAVKKDLISDYWYCNAVKLMK